MERNIVGELDSYYNNLENQYQMQMYKQKMSLAQVQDLANCIKVLGNALSFAENYSMMNGNKSKSEFTNYDYYNASKRTEKSLYFKKLAAAIKNFDGVYDYYISKYNSEPIPKSLEKSDIIMRLENYSKYVNHNERAIYQDFINALNRNPINNVNKYTKSFKGDGTMNPEKIKKTFLDAKGYVDEQNEEEMEEAENDPDYMPDIKMNRNKPAIPKYKKSKKKHLNKKNDY